MGIRRKTHGTLLAEGSASEEANQRLRANSSNHGKRALLSRTVLGSWAVFAGCVTLLIVVILSAGGSIEASGSEALLPIILFLGIPFSFLVAVVVTASAVSSWLRGRVTTAQQHQEGPQDAVASASLRSTSISPLILMVLGWVFLMFVAAGVAGTTGFRVAAVLGFLGILLSTAFLGFMDQRIEVASHEVTVKLLGSRRTIPASSILDIEFASRPAVVTIGNEPLVIHVLDEAPITLAGKFVKDHELTTQFVADARTILELDAPTDAPPPPMPQDKQH